MEDFLEFAKDRKEILSQAVDAAMLAYLEALAKKSQEVKKTEQEKRVPVTSWVPDDLQIARDKKLQEEAEAQKLPHPIER